MTSRLISNAGGAAGGGAGRFSLWWTTPSTPEMTTSTPPASSSSAASTPSLAGTPATTPTLLAASSKSPIISPRNSFTLSTPSYEETTATSDMFRRVRHRRRTSLFQFDPFIQHLLRLPPELLAHIYQYLPYNSVDPVTSAILNRIKVHPGFSKQIPNIAIHAKQHQFDDSERHAFIEQTTAVFRNRVKQLQYDDSFPAIKPTSTSAHLLNVVVPYVDACLNLRVFCYDYANTASGSHKASDVQVEFIEAMANKYPRLLFSVRSRTSNYASFLGDVTDVDITMLTANERNKCRRTQLAHLAKATRGQLYSVRYVAGVNRTGVDLFTDIAALDMPEMAKTARHLTSLSISLFDPQPMVEQADVTDNLFNGYLEMLTNTMLSSSSSSTATATATTINGTVGGSGQWLKLRSLKLSMDFSSFTAEMAVIICNACPSLSELELANMNTSLDAFDVILRKLPRLSSLLVFMCNVVPKRFTECLERIRDQNKSLGQLAGMEYTKNRRFLCGQRLQSVTLHVEEDASKKSSEDDSASCKLDKGLVKQLLMEIAPVLRNVFVMPVPRLFRRMGATLPPAPALAEIIQPADSTTSDSAVKELLESLPVMSKLTI